MCNNIDFSVKEQEIVILVKIEQRGFHTLTVENVQVSSSHIIVRKVISIRNVVDERGCKLITAVVEIQPGKYVGQSQEETSTQEN